MEYYREFTSLDLNEKDYILSKAEGGNLFTFQENSKCRCSHPAFPLRKSKTRFESLPKILVIIISPSDEQNLPATKILPKIILKKTSTQFFL